MDDVKDIVRILAIFSVIIPLVFGFQRRQTLLWLYVLTGFVFDLIITIFLKADIEVKRAVGNVYFVCEFVFLSMYYSRKLFVHNRIFNYSAVGLCVVFVLVTIASSLYKFNNYGAAIFYFTYIVYSVSGLYYILKAQKILYLERSEFFWANVAVLIYASGNFMVLLFVSYLLERDRESLADLWIFSHGSLNIIYHLILAIALTRKNA